ncbi:MAG: SpoIIE family protein phosphatase [Marinilabiliaceae bacterium]|nr:SpoIIE family protein phosphatase [Marinilabiliaceae bacterium]
MMKKKYPGRYLFFLLITLILIYGGEESCAELWGGRTKQFSINEGLSNSQVTALFQDSRGFIWVGTTDGLNRYDGYDFSVFRHHPMDTSSIAGNNIQAITETSNNNIWIGTRNSGIAIWNKKTGTFINLDSHSDIFCDLPDKGVYGLLSIGDNVWVKTRNFVIRISNDLSDFEIFGHYSSVYNAGINVSYPIISGNDCLWVGSKDGIHQFDLLTKSFKRIAQAVETSNKEITGLLNGSDSLLVVGTASGLWQYHYGQSYAHPIPLLADGSAGAMINCLLRDESRCLYIGTDKGIMVSEYPYKSYQPLVLQEALSYNLTDVTALLLDRSGIMWAGTKHDGLIRIDRKPPRFSSITKFSDLQYSLKSYDFESIYVDQDDNIWVGTDKQGVYRIDRKRNQYKQYRINPGYSGLNDPAILSILRDRSGKMWFGTTNGVYLLNQNWNYLEEFDYTGSLEFKTLLKENPINDLLQDQLGNLWIATKFGLYRYNGRKISSYFADAQNETSLCHDEVNTIFEDSDGLLWIGTNDGINIYDSGQGFIKRIQNTTGRPHQISHNIVLAFAEDKNNRVIIGTQSGVSYYNKNTKEVGELSDKSNKVYALEVDAFNSIWMSSGKGIIKLLSNGTIYNFSKKGGVPVHSFNEGASFITENSELYFGGDKGLIIIKADSVQHKLPQPQVVVTDLKVFHKGMLEYSFQHDLDTVEIRYKRNSMLRVEFAAMEFANPLGNSFQVFIEGYDDDEKEIPIIYDNFVNISNLSPGTYTLKVRGANSDFVLNDRWTELVLNVVPPLWMSNYAYAFYIICVIFLIQMLINYRIRNYRKAYKALQDKALDKKKIEAQREALSKINQNLTDSISYAKRIQEAMIPSEEMVKNIIPESFVYFRPKDIVSGDFYWIYRNEKKIFVAAVDCTGHGVPGAFMSIIGYDLLKNIVEIQGKECPARIMDQLNREVVNTFKKNGNTRSMNKQEVNDGMDMALIVINIDSGILEFAGAYNPLYLIRDNEIMTYKGDRFPIGYVDENNKTTFSKQEVSIRKNDIIYLFSDGYADQFGGPEGKKFKYRRFRHLLLNIHKLPIEDQKAILHQKMEEWMGSEYEQIDDILLMGMKL